MKSEDTLKTIREFVKLKFFQNPNMADDKKNIQLEEAMVEKLYSDIRDDIFKIEKDNIKKEAQKELEEEKKSKQISKLKKFMLEGIMIAVIVGLFVNQLTDLATYFKVKEMAYGKITWTFISIVALIVIGRFAFWIKFLDDFADMIRRNDTHGN